MEHNENTASESIEDYSISVADCTSPSQLQEVTLDQDGTFSNTMGMRSPSGPMRGRTVKEFEEQLTNLKKENFNLKLRIYFLEEKMGTNFTLDKDNIVKKNIELQVEVANLQKEVKEKHDLLCQAVKAIEIEEEEHKKYSQSKEEQLRQLQQEMEDLRLQLEDLRYIARGESPKSAKSSRHSQNEPPFVSQYAPEVEIRERKYQDDGEEKEQSHLANFVYDKTENLRHQIDTLQRECDCKDQTIDGLNRELTSSNERLIIFAQQVKEYEEKLAAQHLKNEHLLAKMQEEQKTREKFKAQLAAVNQKYSLTKYEFDQERDEFQREKKSLERTNMMLDMRVSALDIEIRKQKEFMKEQQAKLESAVAEATKHQNLAVSISRSEKQSSSNTDDRLISVPNPATPDGAPQEDPLHVQIKQTGKGKSSLKPQVPPTPDGKNLLTFEKLLIEGGDSDTIRAEFVALKNDFNAQKQKIVRLKSEQLKACEIIKNMIDFRNKANNEIAQLKKAKEEVEKELENVVSKPLKEKASVPLQTRVSEMNITAVGTPPACEKSTAMADEKPQHDSGDLEIVEQYKRLAVELEAKIEVLVETLKEKDSQMQCIRTQYDEILNALEEKENKIVDLEFELLASNHRHSGKLDRSLLEKGDAGSEKRSSFYKQELEEKNREIERLNVELKKCTCYLQEIVNKELWDKNREIEKLHKKQEGTPEVIKLKKELSGKDLQLKLLKEKICELGLDIKLPNDEINDLSPKKNIGHIKTLQEQLKITKEEKKYLEDRVNELASSQDLIDKLKSENDHIKTELDKCERLRHETNEVCTVLSARLEELAIFLDSLLKQKSVLGFLGSAKNKKLREIISNSLDMSRSFSMSLMANPEQSLAQLSNITALLNGSVFQELDLAEDVSMDEETRLSIVPDRVSLTYESHLYKKADGSQPDNEQVIAALREQVSNLKGELQVRDNELNRLQRGDKESGVDRLSESETEDDAKKSPKSASATKTVRQSDGHSESEAWSEPDRAVSRARIGLNRTIPPSPYAPAAKLHRCESTEDDDMYYNMTPSKNRRALFELNQEVLRLEREVEEKSEEITANNAMYRQKLQDMDKDLQESREKLLQAQLEKNSAMKKVENLQKMVEELTTLKKQYEENMVDKDKEMQDKINHLEAEKQKILCESQAYAQQVIDGKNQVIAAQEKVKALEEQSERIEKELRKEYEENLITKLKNAEEVFAKKIRATEEKCEAEVRIAQESLKIIQDEYARDFIKKAEVDKQLNEAEKIVKELAEVKAVLHSYEQTISSYKEKEKDIGQTVQNYRDNLTTLQSELENATARCCRQEQENAKILHEKQMLEQEITKVSQKEEELRSQLKDIQNNLSQVTEKYSDQVAALQKQKNGLELKISELESCNAELHNRLVKAQTSRFSLGLNATLPSNIGSRKPSYRRQCSDQNTYSSEDIGDDLRSFSSNRPAQVNISLRPSAAETERAEANSSPDLGIESDHGRFSSLETNGNNVARPLLQTIELTESMNVLFDGQNHDAELTTSASDHCCQKSVEIAHENNELKRKLLRMKRALEETATQLNLANQRKKQVEKTICKQIHKTSQVLRKAKANLDSGSESDVFRT